ncbi:polynucleotide kinase-phosphatase [Phytomonospora endophytica]|uniref:Polynucleotide kinase-phosphatase n=1 Tax=Phytomonospora endophytica TaxID=714109 RepID=A0A841G4N1_9ACTN|nr:polynucleotide kinase-phosphatase [Phytomonospora endophytica]MBB6039070.1 polynucleotide kinase-phosphatase [Phytomonospora endophytica]GIG63708.1 polynucleotide kinase-phosphatase [Phytomonospora endophytica]
MTEIKIPEVALVALVGVSGSGKSTFAAKHFGAGNVLSGDHFRFLVSGDENDQAVSAEAFDALYYVAAKRLEAQRLTVVDATNTQPHARAAVLKLAKEHHVLPVAIVLDVDEDTCWERTEARPDRDFGRPVIKRQRRDLKRSLRFLAKEGFRRVFVLSTAEDIDGAHVTLEPLWTDKTHLTGPFDIIGDVHGCAEELRTLLGELGYVLRFDDEGRAVGAAHPEGRTAVFVGDLVDRGPDSPGALRLAMGMVGEGTALCVPGNHEDKLARHLRGRKVTVAHGLAETIEQLDRETPEFRAEVVRFIDGLVSHVRLDGGRLVVAHAGIKERLQGRASARVRAFCLYGETTGETDEFGLPVRHPWAREYRGRAMVVYGHTPTPVPEWVNNTICLDTGAVFGGRLTALRYPERELVSVPATAVHYEPVKPFPVHNTVDGPADDGGMLGLGDVTGRRTIETGYGRITIPAEQNAAALEVMSRFALEPARVPWLPPTMAPCSTSTREGYLEHPAEAFADYRGDGVVKVVCEEKHMGSRAVVRVHRDDPSKGAIYTRTGRSFFGPGETSALLTRVASAAEGLFEELRSDWLLLDGELLPWSAKAMGLIRGQYAAVGAAATGVLPAAVEVLRGIADRAEGAGELLASLRERRDNAFAYRDAYRAYVGGDEVTLAPFVVLASEGAAHHARDHGWHLSMADRLVAADPALFTPTRRMTVSLDDEAQVEAATDWWLDLTAAGGEGMVVKPWEGLVRNGRRIAQPGVKCRGREYLRIIYGPDYTRPDNLERLRDRHLGRKRGLAIRENALGMEALDRLAAGEPLWRVHELVFAILALESEGVDPRL